MKFFATFFIATLLGCALESVSATFGRPIYVDRPSRPISLEDLGRGYEFACALIPSVSCTDILESLPPQATLAQAAAELSKAISILRPPGAGGVYSQNPVPRSRLSKEELGDSYAFVCTLIPAINCDEIIRRLPPNADESYAAAVIAGEIAALRIPGPVQYEPFNYYVR